MKRTQAADAVDYKRKISRNKYNSKCLGSDGDNLGADVVALNSDFLTFEKPFFDGSNAASTSNKKLIVKTSQTPMSALPVVSKRISSTTHRKKRLEEAELVVEDGGGK